MKHRTPPLRFARIGKRTVPVTPGETTMVQFAAGAHGKREAGWYRFWCAFGEDQYGPWRVWGRARTRLPPGDRFHRMRRERYTAKKPAVRAAYAMMFRRTQGAQGIAPASMREVYAWALGHKDDAKHIVQIFWRGRLYRNWPRGLRR